MVLPRFSYRHGTALSQPTYWQRVALPRSNNYRPDIAFLMEQVIDKAWLYHDQVIDKVQLYHDQVL